MILVTVWIDCRLSFVSSASSASTPGVNGIMRASPPEEAARAMGFVPNDRQRQATEHVHGPMLVVAGAGTGKTTVLSQRVAYLIANGHARPEEILAVTYTEAAALHLKRKVDQALRDIGAQADTS